MKGFIFALAASAIIIGCSVLLGSNETSLEEVVSKCLKECVPTDEFPYRFFDGIQLDGTNLNCVCGDVSSNC